MDENPFIPFRPARGEYFINRQQEEKLIIENISQGSNTSIIGYPRIGKTSLLKNVENKHITEFQNKDLTVIYINIELMSEEDNTKTFWQLICSKAVEQNLDLEVFLGKYIDDLSFSFHDLFESFEKLGRANKRVVALIDELEKYLDKKGIASNDFMDSIRSISKDSGGFCFVSASRQRISEINNKHPTNGSLLDAHEITLKGFDKKTIENWLSSYGINADTRSEIRLIGDSHPALIQLAGHTLWEIRNEPEKVKTHNREKFLILATTYFNEVWGYLGEKSQLALVLMVLDDFQGKIINKAYNIENINSRLLWLTQELIDLESLGVLEKEEEKYFIGSIAFRAWIVRTKIAEAALGDTNVQKWLHNKEFKIKPDLLTKEELEFIWEVVKTYSPLGTEIIKGLLFPS